jgi:signal transduction histidine kinase
MTPGSAAGTTIGPGSAVTLDPGMSLRALFARLRALDPYRLDALVAGLVLVETQVEALIAGSAVAHVIGVVAAGCVAFHRRAIWPAFLAAQAMFLGGQAAGDVVTDNLVVPLFVVLALNVSAAAQISGRRFWLVPLITATTGIVALRLDDFEDTVSGFLFTIAFFTGATAAGGRLLDSRLRLQRVLREKAQRAEEDRAARAEQAVLDERARIAGDLHDIIAHALSGMVVQASAARRLSDRDPDRAREAFAAVEGSGREALGELRRLLGVLRREDEELALAPAPSLAHVSALAQRVGAAGLPVRVRVEGEAVDLPAGIDVTAYRVVQEALTAALHGNAAGRAEVLVRYGRDGVELEVSDDGTRDEADPRRLVGMRERVALFGGELELAHPREGGHALRARLPVGEPA